MDGGLDERCEFTRKSTEEAVSRHFAV